jgi:hypothetical protein
MVCFQTKNPKIWAHFGGPWNGKCFCFFIFYDHLEYFMAIGYNLGQLGTVVILVYFPHFGAF